MRVGAVGSQLHVMVRGTDGPAAILGHSTGISGVQWIRLARTLAPRRCMMPDWLGYGRSDPAPGGDKDWRVDLDGVLALIDAEDEPVDLVGHSYGGFLVLRAAVVRPDRVRRVLVHEPILWGTLRSGAPMDVRQDFEDLVVELDAMERGGEAWLRGFVEFWNGDGAWAALPVNRANAWRRDGPHIAAEVHGLIDDNTPHTAWRDIKTPLCVTRGEQTAPMQAVVCSVLSENAPNARLVDVPGGHMAPLTDARAWNEVASTFLAS